jgi:hypothetical protein
MIVRSSGFEGVVPAVSAVAFIRSIAAAAVNVQSTIGDSRAAG